MRIAIFVVAALYGSLKSAESASVFHNLPSSSMICSLLDVFLDVDSGPPYLLHNTLILRHVRILDFGSELLFLIIFQFLLTPLQVRLEFLQGRAHFFDVWPAYTPKTTT